MPRYMSLVKYTQDAYEGVRADGYAARPAALQAFAGSLGGSIESMEFMAQGDWDFVTIMEMPTTDAMLAMASFATASGTVERNMTYELFSGEQMDAAVSAHSVSDTAPGS